MKHSNSMTNDRKVITKLFLPWQVEAEQSWLEAMARQGWLLTNYAFVRYHFVKAEPRDYVYRIDYVDPTKVDSAEYQELFTVAGWEYVASYQNWRYFRIPADRFEADIYSDNSSRIEGLKRFFTSIAALYAPVGLSLILLLSGALEPSEGYSAAARVVIIAVLVLELVVTLFWIVIFAAVYRQIHKLRSDIRV